MAGASEESRGKSGGRRGRRQRNGVMTVEAADEQNVWLRGGKQAKLKPSSECNTLVSDVQAALSTLPWQDARYKQPPVTARRQHRQGAYQRAERVADTGSGIARIQLERCIIPSVGHGALLCSHSPSAP